jgi:hypothetical protein
MPIDRSNEDAIALRRLRRWQALGLVALAGVVAVGFQAYQRPDMVVALASFIAMCF